MFRGTPFNQPLNHWGPFMNRFYDLSRIFDNAQAFNQDISSWDMSSATDMEGMFTNATAFNQNIGSWNTAKAIEMAQIFKGATAFNQNLGSWSVGRLGPGATWAGAWEGFQGSGLSTANIDALLCGWAPQTVSASVNLGLGTLRPSCATGEACKTTLAGKGWTIVSGVCI
jgi:surface protein